MQLWCLCRRCTGILACIALAVSPVLCCCLHRHCQPRMGMFALVALDSSPALHPHCRKHCKLASAPSRCNCDTSAYVALSLCSLSLSVVFVAVTGAVPWQLGSYVQPILCWWFCQRCTGVIAWVALASLQASHCRCRHCTGIVTNVALDSLPSLLWHCSHPCKLATAQPRHSHDTFVCVVSLSWSSSLPVASSPYLALSCGPFASDGPAEAALVSLLALCLRPWLHCTSVITNIAPLLLPVLRQHHFPCRMGAFILVLLALLPSLLLRCHQHRKLVSAQAQSSCNTCWRHPQHRALVVANVAPAPFPSLRRCLCPGCAGVTALGTPMLPPASQTGICPVMMQLRPVVGEVLLSRSTLVPVALLLYPESAHSDFGL
jgi:hypothetical protein